MKEKEPAYFLSRKNIIKELAKCYLRDYPIPYVDETSFIEESVIRCLQAQCVGHPDITKVIKDYWHERAWDLINFYGYWRDRKWWPWPKSKYTNSLPGLNQFVWDNLKSIKKYMEEAGHDDENTV